MLSKVQARASKLVPTIKNLSKEDRLNALGWCSLQDRRTRGDLIQQHKIVHGYDKVDFVGGNQLLASSGLESPAGNTRYGHLSVEIGILIEINLKFSILN